MGIAKKYLIGVQFGKIHIRHIFTVNQLYLYDDDK